MGRTLMALALSGFVVLALPVAANEKPTEAYQKAMKDNGAALQAIRAAAKELEDSGAGTQDYAPFVEAAATLKPAFATTLAYWQAQKADDAIAVAQQAIKAIADMESAANDRNYRVVLASFTALGETCTACHAAHRVRLPDGSFEIK